MREKLEAAWLAAHPYPEIGDAIDRFTRLLDAEAWLDAAMMLVPDGMASDVDATAPECGIDWTLHGLGRVRFTGTADTMPEALLAAIEKARTT